MTNDRVSKLYQKYRRLVLTVAMSFDLNPADAENVLQETFKNLYKATYRFRNEQSEKRYIVKRAEWRSLDLIRKYQRTETESYDELEENSPHLVSSSGGSERRDDREVVHLFSKYVKGKGEEKELLFRSIRDRCSAKEVSDELGISVSAAQQKMYRLKRELRALHSRLYPKDSETQTDL